MIKKSFLLIVITTDKQIKFVYANFDAHIAGIVVLHVNWAINDARISFNIENTYV